MARIYCVEGGGRVEIKGEWSLKFGRRIWVVLPYPNTGHTIAVVPTFSEARAIVKAMEAK